MKYPIKSELWKITDNKYQTHNGLQWGIDVTHEADGKSSELCNGHWIHAYQDPLLAIMVMDAHVNYRPFVLWEAEGKIGLEMPDRVGCTSLTTLRIIPTPIVTVKQRQRFAIRTALTVYPLWENNDKNGAWRKWAIDVDLNGTSSADAAAASAYAYSAAAAAAYTTAADVATANANASAFSAATVASYASDAAASNAAVATAYSAAAAAAAAKVGIKLDLVEIAHEACALK